MASVSDLINTTKFCLAMKSEPIFKNPYRSITRFNELEAKDTGNFDTNNWQIFTHGPTISGMFDIIRLSKVRGEWYYQQYLDQCKAWGDLNPRPYGWEYEGAACHSQRLFRFDIYKPGRIVVKSTMPEEGCGSVWLFYAEQESDWGKPHILSIDRPPAPRKVYWEIDLFETFKDPMFKQRIGFAGHFLKNGARAMKNKSIVGKQAGWHYPEVRWDGNGNWTWLFDNVVVHKDFIYQPENIYPYMKCTFMAMEKLPASMEISRWNLYYIKMSRTIDLVLGTL